MNGSQTGEFYGPFSSVFIDSGVTGLVAHLRTYFPVMYKLWADLKQHGKDRPPTLDELHLAAN